MKKKTQIVVFILLVGAGLCRAAGKPKISYYKAGKVGAFHAKLPMPNGLNAADVILTPHCESKDIYLLYSAMPMTDQMQQAIDRRARRGQLTDAQVAKRKALQKQIDTWQGHIDATRIPHRQGRITAMEALLRVEKLKKTEAQDKALIRRLRTTIATQQTEVNAVIVSIEVYEKNIRELREKLYRIQPQAWSEQLNAEQKKQHEELIRKRMAMSDGPNRWEQTRRLEEEIRTLDLLLAEQLRITPKEKRLVPVDNIRQTRAKRKLELNKLVTTDSQADKQREAIDAKIYELEKIAGQHARKVEKDVSLEIFGRFQGKGPATIVVMSRGRTELLAAQTKLIEIKLDLPAKDGGAPAVLRQWATLQARYQANYCRLSPYTSFHQYSLLQSIKKHGVSEQILPQKLQNSGDQAWGPRAQRDLYSITTGALAIQESLQLEAMTARRTLPEDRGVKLSSLKGPKVKSHPFKKMLAGRKPKMFPAATLAPHDDYYCHFASISKFIATTDLMHQWGGSLLHTVSVTARNAELPRRYQQQLCIGVSRLTRLFGDQVIADVAITGSDPFFFEGTDLTVLINVKLRLPFDRQMASYIDNALKQNSDAKKAQSKHEGVAILSVTTPDKRISSHSAYVGSYKVYSNSLGALKRIIDTAGGRRKSIAQNLDFQYMRTIFPGSPKDEDGFLYFSDSFIRKITGPRWKISEQRRIICQNHIRMACNAATMHRKEMRQHADIATLISTGYLDKDVLRCPDAGSYKLDKTGVAHCSVHNRLGLCTPVDSIPLDKVSNREARDYMQFVRNYNDYWSQYFDPIGIRLQVGDRVEIETCILPLIENSMYNQVRELFGGKAVPLKARVITNKTILSLAASVDLSRPEYVRMVDRMQKQMFPTVPPITKAIGNSISIGLCDGDVLFTVDSAGLSALGGLGGMNLGDQLALSTILSAINLPVYAVVDLKDEKLARTIVRQLLASWTAPKESTGFGFGDNWFQVEQYASGKYKTHAVGAITIRLLVIKFRLHWSIANGRLVISTKRHVLESLLDALDNNERKELKGNVQLDIIPRAYNKLLPAAQAGWQERSRQACFHNLIPMLELATCYTAKDQPDTTAARRIHGEVPYCPSGGKYTHDPLRRTVYCSVHGNYSHPRQPVAPTGNERIIKFLRSLKTASVNFKFTKEGIRTKVTLDMDAK